jgi:hypothetical protein
MKIAILDNCFLSKSQLQRLRDIGELTCYGETSTEDEAMKRLKGVEIKSFVKNQKIFTSK